MTLLGFSGVTPNVALYVDDIGKPIQVCLVFVLGPGTGTYTISLELTAEGSAKPFVTVSPGQAVIPPGKSSFNLAFQIVGPFPGPGRYGVRLLADKKERFVSSFELRPGPLPA